MELQQQKKRDQEEAQYSDNNFWKIKSASEAEADVDELLRELDEGDDSAGKTSPEEPSQKEEDNNEGQSSLQDAAETEQDDDNKEQKEEQSEDSSQAKSE